MRIVTVMLMFCLVALVSARAEFAAPTAAQSKAAAEDPAKIKDLLKDATPAQASTVLMAVIKEVQGMALKVEQKKERVAKLFAAVQEAMGKDAGAVIADVASRINPELLPAVAGPGVGIVAQPGMPIAQPLAPPIAPKPPPGAPVPPPPVAPKYSGQ